MSTSIDDVINKYLPKGASPSTSPQKSASNDLFNEAYSKLEKDFEYTFGKPLTSKDNPLHHRPSLEGRARDARTRDKTPEEQAWIDKRANELGLDVLTASGKESWATGPHKHIEAKDPTDIIINKYINRASSTPSTPSTSSHQIGGETPSPLPPSTAIAGKGLDLSSFSAGKKSLERTVKKKLSIDKRALPAFISSIQGETDEDREKQVQDIISRYGHTPTGPPPKNAYQEVISRIPSPIPIPYSYESAQEIGGNLSNTATLAYNVAMGKPGVAFDPAYEKEQKDNLVTGVITPQIDEFKKALADMEEEHKLHPEIPIGDARLFSLKAMLHTIAGAVPFAGPSASRAIENFQKGRVEEGILDSMETLAIVVPAVHGARGGIGKGEATPKTLSPKEEFKTIGRQKELVPPTPKEAPTTTTTTTILPKAPPVDTTGLTMPGMGQAIADNMYQSMFDNLSKNKYPEPGKKANQSPFALHLMEAWDKGEIKSIEDIKTLASKFNAKKLTPPEPTMSPTGSGTSVLSQKVLDGRDETEALITTTPSKGGYEVNDLVRHEAFAGGEPLKVKEVNPDHIVVTKPSGKKLTIYNNSTIYGELEKKVGEGWVKGETPKVEEAKVEEEAKTKEPPTVQKLSFPFNNHEVTFPDGTRYRIFRNTDSSGPGWFLEGTTEKGKSTMEPHTSWGKDRHLGYTKAEALETLQKGHEEGKYKGFELDPKAPLTPEAKEIAETFHSINNYSDEDVVKAYSLVEDPNDETGWKDGLTPTAVHENWIDGKVSEFAKEMRVSPQEAYERLINMKKEEYLPEKKTLTRKEKKVRELQKGKAEKALQRKGDEAKFDEKLEGEGYIPFTSLKKNQTLYSPEGPVKVKVIGEKTIVVRDAEGDLIHVSKGSELHKGLSLEKAKTTNPNQEYIDSLIHDHKREALGNKLVAEGKYGYTEPQAELDGISLASLEDEIGQRSAELLKEGKITQEELDNILYTDFSEGKGKSVGAAHPSNFPVTPDITQLGEDIRQRAQGNIPTEDYSLGDRLARGIAKTKETIQNISDAATATAHHIWEVVKRPSEIISEFQKVVDQWQGKRQEGMLSSKDFEKVVKKAITSKLQRDAMTLYRDTGGDKTLLQEGALRSPDPMRRKAYEAALSLTQDQIDIVNNVGSYFDAMLQHGLDEGMLWTQLENYINRVYDKESALRLISRVQGDFQQGILPTAFQHAKRRFYKYLLDAEMQGMKPKTTDIAELIPIYNAEFNNTMAARGFVRDAYGVIAPDGRPVLLVLGSKSTKTSLAGNTYDIIRPKGKKDAFNPTYPDLIVDPSGYVAKELPGFKNWKLLEWGDDGRPVYVEAQIGIHPDYIGEFKRRLGNSPFDESPVGRLAKRVKAEIKAPKMAFSAFHQVAVDVHALTHRVFNPYQGVDVARIPRQFMDYILKGESPDTMKTPLYDPSNPMHKKAVYSGVKLVDSRGISSFAEGVSGGESIFKIPILGKRLSAYTHWLFEDHIPRLKLMYYEQAYVRNMKGYAKQLASGKITEPEIARMTANQTNASFGELNYEQMGRSKFAQDIMGFALLAPDFTEARLRYVGQALKPYGREQRIALGLGALAMYTTARILNGVFNNGETHWDDPKHAFEVKVGEKWIGVRSVPGDLIHLYNEPGQSIVDRLSPPIQIGATLVTGRDRFGEKIVPQDKLSITKEAAKQLIPMSFNKDLQTSILQAIGLSVRKYVPPSKTSYFEKKGELEEKQKELRQKARENKKIFPLSQTPEQ